MNEHDRVNQSRGTIILPPMPAPPRRRWDDDHDLIEVDDKGRTLRAWNAERRVVYLARSNASREAEAARGGTQRAERRIRDTRAPDLDWAS